MKLFQDMTFDEKMAHIERCQGEGLDEIRKGSPACLADISDHLDLWGPELIKVCREFRTERDALKSAATMAVEELGKISQFCAHVDIPCDPCECSTGMTLLARIAAAELRKAIGGGE